jgi:hypothetical protein
METQEIISKLEYYDGTFPKEALEAAIEQKEEIIPELLKILENTSKNADDFVGTDYWAHIYGIHLLAQFKEKKAYPLIVDAFSLPGEKPFELYGDVVTGSLKRILASVSQGDISLIKLLIEKKEVNEYVKSAALQSLVILFANNELDRDMLIQYFKELFDTKLERKRSVAWSNLACCSVDLHPEELIEEIEKSFELGLVDDAYISLQNVKETLKEKQEDCLEILHTDPYLTYIEDTIDELEGWACFDKNDQKEDKLVEDLFENAAELIPQAEVDQFRKRQESYYQPESEPVRTEPKIGRNQPCPCGSGKKYKKCCGKK